MPHYTMEEITEKSLINKDLSYLFLQAEQLMRKALSNSDIITLYSIYEWIGLPVEVLLMLMKYCIASGKGSLRFIAREAEFWSDRGIRTLEDADRFVMELEAKKSHYSLVKRIFGIQRNLIKDEKEKVDIWFSEWKYDDAMVQMAFESCVTSIGKLSFSYIHKILSAWQEKGIRKPAQVLAEKDAFQLKKKNKKPEKNAPPSYDLDEIERRAFEKLHS